MVVWEAEQVSLSSEILGSSEGIQTSREPLGWSVQMGVGEEMFHRGDFLGCAEAFTDAIALLPMADPNSRSELLVKRAFAFLRGGKYPEAKWDAELVLKDKDVSEARMARAHAVRAMLRRQRDDFDGCKVDLDAALTSLVWSDKARKQLQALLNAVCSERQKFRPSSWLFAIGTAVFDWIVWYVLPLTLFSSVWLITCIYSFSTLWPSGELGADAWRSQLSSTIGVLFATVIWGWWVQEDIRRSKEPGSKHVSMKDWLSRFVISVRVFGFISAVRMMCRVIKHGNRSGSRDADITQLKQDISDIQKHMDPSRGKGDPKVPSHHQRQTGNTSTDHPPANKGLANKTGKDHRQESIADHGARAHTVRTGCQGSSDSLSSANMLHSSSPPNTQGSPTGTDNDGANNTVSRGGVELENNHRIGVHKKCTGGESALETATADNESDKLSAHNREEGRAHAAGQAVEQNGQVKKDKTKAQKVENLTASMKVMNDGLEVVKKALESERNNVKVKPEASSYTVSIEPSVTDEDIAASGDRQYESNLVKESGNEAYKKANQMCGAPRQRKLKEAFDLYSKAHHIDPENVAVLTNRAAVLMALGNHAEAVADCAQAIQTSKKIKADAKLLARAYERLGKAEMFLGHPVAAAQAFTESIALVPSSETENLLSEAQQKADKLEAEAKVEREDKTRKEEEETRRKEEEDKRKKEEEEHAERQKVEAAIAEKERRDREKEEAARLEVERKERDKKLKEEKGAQEKVAREEQTKKKREEEEMMKKKRQEEERKKKEDEERGLMVKEERDKVQVKSKKETKEAAKKALQGDKEGGAGKDETGKAKKGGNGSKGVMHEIGTPVHSSKSGSAARDVADDTMERFKRAEAIKESGTALFQAGHYSQAKAKYLHALDAFVKVVARADVPESSRAMLIACHLNVAACALKSGDMEEISDAVLHSSAALRMDPSNVKALYRHGNALFLQGDVTGALSHLHKAAEISPHDPAVLALLRDVEAKHASSRGSRKAPVQAPEEGALVGKKAPVQAPHAAKIIPKRATDLKLEGDASFKSGMFDRAVLRYTEAINELPTASADLQEERATWLNNRAAANLQTRDYEAVIKDCNQVLTLQPNNIKALLRRGLALEQTEKFEASAADMRSVLSMDDASEGSAQLKVRARECLTRCHRLVPSLAKIPIPISHFPSGRGRLQAESQDGTVNSSRQEPDLPPSSRQGGDSKQAAESSQGKRTGSESSEVTGEEEEEEDATTRSVVTLADNLKSEGNGKFSKGMYSDAMQDYSDALEMLQRANVRNTQRVQDLSLVCHMNVAACAIKKSVGLKREHAAAEMLDLAVARCNKVLEEDKSRVKALFRRGQAYAEAAALSAEARAAYQQLNLRDQVLTELAIKDLESALASSNGDKAIEAALKDARTAAAKERRCKEQLAKMAEQKTHASNASHESKSKAPSSAASKDRPSAKAGDFQKWDKIDYDAECERLDDEALRESGMSDIDVQNKKILDIVQNESLDEEDKMRRCMKLVGHADWQPSPLSEEEKLQRDNEKFLRLMQDPRRSGDEKMSLLSNLYKQRLHEKPKGT